MAKALLFLCAAAIVHATGQTRLSDMGGGATFHDNLVQVERDAR